jgi:DNA (cytosine-5)-methyltransferase 1
MIGVSREFAGSNKIRLRKRNRTRTAISKLIQPKENVEKKYFLESDNKYYKLINEKVDATTPSRLYQLRKYQVRVQEVNVCPTLTANMGGGGHNVPFVAQGSSIRRLTEVECLKLQGFPAKFKFPKQVAMTRRYRMIGNAVSPMVSDIIACAIKDFLK